MIRKLVYGVKHILELDVPGSDLVVYPDDTFLVSQPKAGSTWMRFLIANLLRPDKPVTILEMERIVPLWNGGTKRFFKAMPRPRVIKYHGPFNPRYERVIYVVRDPRDSVISGYYHGLRIRRIDEGYPIPRYVDRFMRGETADYGSWGDNVASWLATRGHSPNFLLLRYEDLLSNTASELAKVASFLNLDATPELLAQATERSSKENMRKLEKVEGNQWHETRNTRKDIPFVRSASAGQWQSRLPESSVAQIESAWGPLMKALGYELSDEANRRTTNQLIEETRT